MMNQLQAARDTMNLVKRHYSSEAAIRSSTLPITMRYFHLEKMILEMEKNEMSESKMGRWLGWMQASAVALLHPAVSLEDMKEINRRHK